MHFKNKKYGVLGLARSGLATINMLIKEQAIYYAWDDNSQSQKNAIHQGFALTPFEDWPWDELDALILSPGIPHQWPAPHHAAQIAKSKNLPIISDIELFIAKYPSHPLIAITGTNGKSTTTSLLYHIFNCCDAPALMGGNIGQAVHTLKPKQNEAFILELSSYQLEITPHIKPNISALINLTPDHLERHGGMDQYIKAKSLLFAHQDQNDTAFINIDDQASYQIYQSVKNQTSLIPISVKKECHNGLYTREGWLIDDRQQQKEKVFELSDASFLKGAHNHQNIAFAYGIATLFGLPKEKVIKAITTYKGLKHRQQYVGQFKNMAFINDSKATNGEAAAKALSSYKNILWLLGGQSKEDGLAKCLHFTDNIEKAFIFGQDKDLFAQMLPDQLKQGSFKDMNHAFASAVSYAKQHPDSDFVILLSPAAASFDQFADFEKRGELFLSLYHNLHEDIIGCDV